MPFERSKEIVRLFKRELIVYQRVLQDDRTSKFRELASSFGYRLLVYAVRFDTRFHPWNRTFGRCGNYSSIGFCCASLRSARACFRASRAGHLRPSHSPIMKYWEVVADNLKKAGWSLGWVFSSRY